MKLQFLFIIVFLQFGCVSAMQSRENCDFNGYSFCLSLPDALRVSGSDIAVDFFVHSFSNKEDGYDVLIYEGNHPDLGENPEILSNYQDQFGQVNYLVEETKTETSAYEVVLRRIDYIRIPKTIHIKTNAVGREKNVISDILSGLKGCKEIPDIESRCIVD